MLRLSDEVAGGFYAEHRERPFFPALIEFMTSGPVVVQVLEGDNAIAKNRELMGATNPQEAARALSAPISPSIDANAVHGSDSPESAARDRLLLSPPAKSASARRGHPEGSRDCHPPASDLRPRVNLLGMTAAPDGGSSFLDLGKAVPRPAGVEVDSPRRASRTSSR